jgi:hypothetical protein
VERSVFAISEHIQKGEKELIMRIVIIPLILMVFFMPRVCKSETFFPIGMASVGIDGLATVRKAGFNSAYTYVTDAAQLKGYIEKAEEVRLRLLIFPADRADKGGINNGKVKNFIEANKNSKSILAWYIADEPDLSGGTPSQIEKVNALIKNMDQSHPTAIVIHRTDRFKEYRDASDVLIIDRYPVPRWPLSRVAEAVNWAVSQKGSSGPVWAVLQAFGYQNRKLKGWGAREPTYDEMKAMTFLSIIHGAKGIFYYTFTGSEYRILQSPEHWNDLKRIVAELNRIYPLLLLPNDDLKIRIEITEGLQKDEWGVLPVHLAIRHLTKDSGRLKAGRYIIAANSLDRPVKATFQLSGDVASSDDAVDIFDNNRKVDVERGTISLSLRPYGVQIHMIANK